jgi:Stage II sporulation protein E (SpoIIE)
VLASVAISAYRTARRTDSTCPTSPSRSTRPSPVRSAAASLRPPCSPAWTSTPGRLRWINAGHPEPLILRGSSLVRPPACPTARPLGLLEGKPVCCETRLEPGDRLLLYTDGITEAPAPGGEFFGKQRLADFVSATVAAGRPALETVRRLMRQVLNHPAEQLQGDNRAQMARNDPYLAAPVALTGATWGLTSGCRLRAASGIAYGG